MNIKSVKKINETNPRDQSTILACYEVKINDDHKLYHAPIDEENTYYIEIMKWVADGNTIEEAD